MTSKEGGSSPFSAATYVYAQVHAVQHPNTNSSHGIRRRSFLVLFVAFTIIFMLLAASVFNNTSEEPNVNDEASMEIELEQATITRPIMLDRVDPDEFEKEVEELIGEDNELLQNIKTTPIKTPLYTFDGEMPKDCKSRRNDNPGVEDGARVHFIHVPRSGGNSVVSDSSVFLKLLFVAKIRD